MRYLFDTNVVSDIRRRDEHTTEIFRRNIAALPVEDVAISVVTIAEIMQGIARLATLGDHRQARHLESWLHDGVIEVYRGRILDFTTAIALAAGRLRTPAWALTCDAQIAATATVHGLRLVSRNTKDFIAMGVTVSDPYAA